MHSPGSSTNQRAFKRGYVACVSCRARKSRCIIKDKPPCSKCEREHRECRFDHRPKGPKHREAPKWTKDASSNHPPDTTSPLQTTNDHVSPPTNPIPQHQTTLMDTYPTENTGFTVSPNNPGHSLYDRVRSSIVTGSNDALNILSDAAAPQHSIAGSTPSQLPNSVLASGPTVQPGGLNGLGFTIISLSEPDDATLDLWDKSRFVREGCFTAQEAVTYIDLFFEKLAPLSPIMVDQFRDHSAHTRLVCEEAMLCCTLLMISSRFFMLPGAGGTSRSHYIHQRLWSHCELLLKRVLFGQEKTSTSLTRIVGTVESLLLISDWHPRALHFPPETDGWDGSLISPGYDRVNRKTTNNEAPLIRWRDDVFEPAKRANRMSWMLLGMATNLAYELGVFSNPPHQSAPLAGVDEARSVRAQKLLYVYVTQTATRLGYPSMFSESISVTASRLPSRNSNDSTYRSWMAYMELSLELTQLSRTASSMFFQSTSHLQSQVLGDHYADLLEHFSPSLSKWQSKFETLSEEIKNPLKDELLIEFYHLKACTGAISIQAVVARASSSGYSTANPSSDEALSAFITSKDAKFLQEVISDSKTILHTATMSDFQAHLPYAPARVKISVISASVFLLKALSVGSTYTDVHATLYNLDQYTTTLRSSPGDDMDFTLRYATLIEKHTAQFRGHLSMGRGQAPPEQSNRGTFQGSGIGSEEPGNDESSSYLNSQQSGKYLDFLDLENAGDTWLSLPFDSSIAPFNGGCDQLSLGLDVDSLNFLWSLPELA